MEKLTVQTKKGLLTVDWTNKNDLAWYATQQAGCYHADLSSVNWHDRDRFLPLHNEHFQNWNRDKWTDREKLGVFDLPDNARVMDIGCGAAISDLLLYSYIPSSTFYLLDNEGEWPSFCKPYDVSYTEDHPFYHSWKPVKDAIESSNFDLSRFNFLSPSDEFPKELDLVMSSFSWCYHYPKETYWSNVVDSLKIGGKLFLDVRILQDRDIIKEISEEMNADPIKIDLDVGPEYLDDENETAYRCLWTRKA